MGCTTSTSSKGQKEDDSFSRPQSQNDWLSDMASRRIVQIMDTTSGMVIGPGENKGGSTLIYRRTIDTSTFMSFFELCTDGTISHFDSQLKISGESGDVVCGLALALQANSNPEVFQFDEDGYWRHVGSKTLMQPAGNAVIAGAKVMAMEDFTKVGNALTDCRVSLVTVPLAILKAEWEKKQKMDQDLAFEMSSDGRIAKLRAKGVGPEDVNASAERAVGECDPAIIEVGMRGFRIATAGNPVLHLSARNVLSLQSLAGEAEVWQVHAAQHVPNAAAMSKVDESKIYGVAVVVSNLNGETLAVNSSLQLCYCATANVWTILDGGESSVILVNTDFKVALVYVGGMIALKPAYECGITGHRWSIHQQ